MDFNRYGDTYEEVVEDAYPIFRHVNAEVFARTKAAHLVALTKRRLGRIADRSVLDVGCGVGVTDRFLVEEFGRVEGVDTADALVVAATTANPGILYKGYDGSHLPYDDDEFDVTFAICVLHHVDPPGRLHTVEEMARVTRPGGIVAVFEHNPWNPVTRRLVRNCDFDEGVILLRLRRAKELLESAGLSIAERRFITFLPLAGRVPMLVEKAFGWLPLGAQYYAAGIKKP